MSAGWARNPPPPHQLHPSPPVSAAWHGVRRTPPAASPCSPQSHRPSCDCHRLRAQTARPPPAGPARGSSPRSHPCRAAVGGAGPGNSVQGGQEGQKVSPERVVALHHEAAKGSVVPAAQGSRCLGSALNFTHNVPCPPEALLAHQLPASCGQKVGREAPHCPGVPAVWAGAVRDLGPGGPVSSYLRRELVTMLDQKLGRGAGGIIG